MALLAYPNMTEFDYTMEEAFPDVDPGQRPMGSNVMVLIRRPKSKSKGGIRLPEDVRSTEYYNTQVGKVIALGPLCFKNRDTMKTWPEGAWCDVGDFVYVPKFGGVRFAIKHPFKDEELNRSTGKLETKTVDEDVMFVYFKDTSLIGFITGDPLKVKAFLD